LGTASAEVVVLASGTPGVGGNLALVINAFILVDTELPGYGDRARPGRS
jgi:hypothetical protein